ncbi:MAG: hypothetical protein AAGA68_26595 [Pseudomonadota bacterium]
MNNKLLALAVAAAVSAPAQSQPFPPEINLVDLYPGLGGDGSVGAAIRGPQFGALLGNAVSPAGDLNGDGIDDFVAGAYNVSGVRDYSGACYVIYGQPGGYPPLSNVQAVQVDEANRGFAFLGIQEDSAVGSDVAGGRDFNGDGHPDLLIGAARRDADPGRAYLIFGPTDDFPGTVRASELLPGGGGDGSDGVVFLGFQFADDTGRAVEAADVNGDGLDDILIAAPRVDAPLDDNGAIYVVFGSNGPFDAVFSLSSLFAGAGGDGSEGFLVKGTRGGSSIGDGATDQGLAAGDFNGDGFDDFLVTDRGLQFEDGNAFVVFGKGGAFEAELSLTDLTPAGGGDGSAGFIITGTNPNSVGNGGDLNGDGVDDMVVANFRSGGLDDQRGEVFVIFGGPAMSAQFDLNSLRPQAGGDGTEGLVLTGEEIDDYAGFSVAAAGDVNGDGIGDLLIGAERGEKAYLVFGRESGWPAEFSLGSLREVQGGDGSAGVVFDNFPLVVSSEGTGFAVSAAGDVNMDGIDDLLITAREGDTAIGQNAGEVFVIYGRAE